MRQSIRDELNREIGWSEQVGSCIYYYSWKCGPVGYFDTSLKRYIRQKVGMGLSAISMAPGADYGVSDVLFWERNN